MKILRTHQLNKWARNGRFSLRFDELNRTPNANYDTFKKAIEHEDPAISANVLWCLINLTIFLLEKQILAFEKLFGRGGDILLEDKINYEDRIALKEYLESELKIPIDIMMKDYAEPIILHRALKDIRYATRS